MLTLLAKFFIKDHKNYKNPKVRQAYGMLCGLLGILLNLVLFAGKYLAGVLTGSIAITADAFNNLSDAGSSLITLIGFKMAGQKPDLDHPFGHGRIEYISGLIVAALILLMGFELAQTSFDKILNPEATGLTVVSAIILIASIAIKGYMALYNNRTAGKIDSAAMKATGTDCLSDMASTAVVLICSLVGHFTDLALDGYCGLAVSALILFAGYSAAKDTLGPLLGQAPEPEFIQKIQTIVMDTDIVTGIHDLIIHDYGPGRQMISLHAEVPVNVDILAAHDTIDNLERELKEQLGCDAVIHMDPIATDDELTTKLKAKVMIFAEEIAPEIGIHDFRVVTGDTHTNIIFDAVVPFSLEADTVKVQLSSKIEAMQPEDDSTDRYYAVINIDRPYH